MHAGGAVFELAHALVDQVDQVLHDIGNGRIDGVAGVAGGRCAAPRRGPAPCGARDTCPSRPGCARRGCRASSSTAGPAAVENVDEFLEIEQPERQLEVAGVDDIGARAEAAAEFVVAVEQEDAQVRARVENFVEDDGDAARLADAGRAEHREMLGQHVVDRARAPESCSSSCSVPMSIAVVVAARVDQPQFVAADDADRVADRRIDRDAAREAGGAVRRRSMISPMRSILATAPKPSALVLALDLGDDADQPAMPDPDAQEGADGRARFVERGRGQADMRLGTAHATRSSRSVRASPRWPPASV